METTHQDGSGAVGGAIVLSEVGLETKAVKMTAPKEWSEMVKKEFDKMDEDFKKWMMGKEDEDLPAGVKYFREYLSGMGERKMEGMTNQYVYEVLSNRLVAKEIDRIMEAESFDEEKLKVVICGFAGALCKAVEVPISEAGEICDLRKEVGNELVNEYGKMCNLYEEEEIKRDGLIKKQRKTKGVGGKGDRQKKVASENQIKIEQEMGVLSDKMNQYIDEVGFPIEERLRLNTYFGSLFKGGPYRREEIQNYLERQRKDVATRMWTIANVLRTTSDVNKVVDRISDGWDRLFTRKRLLLEQRVARLNNSDEVELWEVAKREMKEYQERAIKAKDVVTEELYRVFDLEKPKMEKRMDSMKVGEIKTMFFLTIDQIKGRTEENHEMRASREMEARGYLNFLETKFKQIKLG